MSSTAVLNDTYDHLCKYMNPLYYCSSYWPHNSTLSRTHTYLHIERGELFFRKTWEIIENRYFIPFFFLYLYFKYSVSLLVTLIV